MSCASSSDPRARRGPILALDVSGARASVYLGSGEADDPAAQGCQLAAASLPSERLVAAVAAVLDGAGCRAGELAAVVVANGPGSFTGLRVGLATAKGLCLGAGVPLYTVSSLAVMAASAAARAPAPAWQVVACDARQEAVYVAAYEVDGGGRAMAVLADRAMPLAAAAAWLRRHGGGRRLGLSGDAAPALAEALAPAPAATVDGGPPSARLAVVQAAAAISAGQADDLFACLPRYLRGPAVLQGQVAAAAAGEAGGVSRGAPAPGRAGHRGGSGR